MRRTVAYLDGIADSESAEFVRLYVAEQAHRETYGGRIGGQKANAERVLKKAEAVEAKRCFAAAREEYLATASRAK
ncbi:hypothetical protein [Demequina sp. NBRC 110055]|uniref:hypothetical protein n=1 Tax=Demequina sp. NBRC 110055 TaxID=1570344 RepID=UPI0013564ED5|nr:hypothetical protein [Demequina sp. NBRC 110055]